jgi:hypothetical protein
MALLIEDKKIEEKVGSAYKNPKVKGQKENNKNLLVGVRGLVRG